MHKKTIIQLRAIFLLIVFFLNTGIGFACAVHSGLWKGKEQHMHRMDGTHTTHHPAAPQEKSPASHHCCGDGMIKFEQLDKSMDHQPDSVLMPFCLLQHPVFYIAALQHGYRTIPHEYVVLRQHPPPEDIRVSIQSFQI
jgi:hypothetical protein